VYNLIEQITAKGGFQTSPEISVLIVLICMKLLDLSLNRKSAERIRECLNTVDNSKEGSE